MAPRYRVTLTKEERKDLEAISTKGKRAARTVLYARALLLLDAGEHGPKWVVAQVAGRIDCIEKMRIEVAAWNTDRNNRQTKVDWQFKTDDARIKLKRLYPKL